MGKTGAQGITLWKPHPAERLFAIQSKPHGIAILAIHAAGTELLSQPQNCPAFRTWRWADATQFIKKLNSEFDLIFLDAFGEYGAPEESAHTEFLHDLSCCLNKEGWLVGNLWTITGDFMERRAKWESTFRQLFQARANEKGNIILYASQNSKTHDKQTIKEISKYLHKRHQLDFHRMHNKLEAVK